MGWGLAGANSIATENPSQFEQHLLLSPPRFRPVYRQAQGSLPRIRFHTDARPSQLADERRARGCRRGRECRE